MSIYNDVLRELVTAVGAALFLGNLLALVRRRSGTQVGATRGRDTLPKAPVTRTVVYLVIGFVVPAASARVGVAHDVQLPHAGDASSPAALRCPAVALRGGGS